MFRGFISTVLLLAVCAPAYAQMSPEAAMARLKEKQAERNAARNKPVTITQGEYDDLKAEINRLKAQLAALQAKETATAPVVAPSPTALTVGISKAQVMRFIQVHRETFELKMDDTAATGGKGVMQIVEKAKHRVFDGTFGYNGQSHFANYREMLRPDREYNLTVVNDTVTAVNSQKITTAQADEVAPLWRGR